MKYIDSWWNSIEFEKEEGARGHKRRRNVSVQHGVWSKSLNEHLDMARKTKNNLDYGSTFSHLISPNTYLLEREVTRTDELSNTRDNVISNISQHVRDKLDIPPACTQAAAGIISTHCTAVHCEVCNDIFNNGIAGMENNIGQAELINMEESGEHELDNANIVDRTEVEEYKYEQYDQGAEPFEMSVADLEKDVSESYMDVDMNDDEHLEHFVDFVDDEHSDAMQVDNSEAEEDMLDTPMNMWFRKAAAFENELILNNDEKSESDEVMCTQVCIC